MLVALNKRYKIFFTFKNLMADIFCKFFLLSYPSRWSAMVATRFSNLFYEVKTNNGKTLNFLANSDLLYYRADTFTNKEPETNNWLATIPKDGVFFDVGANVGVFTLMATAYCRRVYAFEPVALNYSVLNQNLMVNSLDQIATAYCLAISDKSFFDTMRLSSGAIGSAHHTFGQDLDACHEVFSPVFKQGAFSVTLDELVYKFNFECPTYLKVDVDGNEHLVMGGATELLKDYRLKSILIELNKNLKIDNDLVEKIKLNGFILKEVGEEAELRGMKIGNLIFERK